MDFNSTPMMQNIKITLNSNSYSCLASRVLGTRKSITRKIVLENLSNNMYGTISTKCCDYLNIPMS
ncbi:hypothetical protein H8356DRAFT_1352899 [Neocallimastix lanati (nom. inval.)]|nr:hypothetical protein H8356DRAFT_1352899 [Neocallimastix sp. JGI-2020a]